MITARDIAKKTMTNEKKATARNDFFAFYIGRPLSYVLTIPFLYTTVSPNAISVLSIIPLIAGFLLACFAHTRGLMLLCWCMFFLWNLLDGVDGNVARYKEQYSKYGSVYDAMAGYAAAVLTYYSMGILGAHQGSVIFQDTPLSGEIILILGGLSALANIFPRLVMHKTISTVRDNESVNEVKEKQNYSITKIIMLNLWSVSGGAQVLMLAAILLNCMDIFTMFYFLLNAAVMLASLQSIFREK